MNNCKHVRDYFVLDYQAPDGRFYCRQFVSRRKLNRFMNDVRYCIRVCALRATAVFEDPSVNFNNIEFELN